MRGTVIAVGAGKIDENGKKRAMEVKEKDEIIYSKYSGTEVKIDNNEYLILKEDDVLAIIQG